MADNREAASSTIHVKSFRVFRIFFRPDPIGEKYTRRDRCSIIRVLSLLHIADTENQIESSAYARSPIIFRSRNRWTSLQESKKIRVRSSLAPELSYLLRLFEKIGKFLSSSTLRWTNTAVSLDAFAIRIEPAGTIFNETSVTFAYRDIQFCKAAKNKGSAQGGRSRGRGHAIK